MTQIGRVDAINITIEPPEMLRDAPLATVRAAVRQNAEIFLENLAQQIHREFVSAPRVVHSIEHPVELGRIDAPPMFDQRVHIILSH
mgnify:CR=1 FL=1